MLGILGKKIGMTQVFDANGNVIPVTVVEAGPMHVTQIKTVETDGYTALQVAFGETKPHRVNKPVKGHFAKAGVELKKFVREFTVEDASAFSVGQEIKADLFNEGAAVDVTGVSKGKGTQGVIKRWNHSRGPETHGSKSHRLPGSIGAGTFPGKVVKGMPMAGRMGREKVTIQNIEVVRVEADRNLILLKGAVPGPKGCLLTIRPTVKSGKL
jgi:large subunit ribosomal protein L3